MRSPEEISAHADELIATVPGLVGADVVVERVEPSEVAPRAATSYTVRFKDELGVVGHLVLVIHDDDPGTGWINNTMLDERLRGKHVWSRATAVLRPWLIELGCTRFMALVDNSNPVILKQLASIGLEQMTVEGPDGAPQKMMGVVIADADGKILEDYRRKRYAEWRTGKLPGPRPTPGRQ